MFCFVLFCYLFYIHHIVPMGCVDKCVVRSFKVMVLMECLSLLKIVGLKQFL